MVASISSLRPGFWRGNTSASFETNRLGGCVGELAQNRLASDHHDVVDVRDHTRRADDVLQVRTRHEVVSGPGSKRE
jgi:hypothetical protein